MKTRTIILACLWIIAAGQATAQKRGEATERKSTVETIGDSIIIHKGTGDLRIRIYERGVDEQKETEIHEGVYLEEVDMDNEKQSFLDMLPFTPKKRRVYRFEPHFPTLYLGYGKLADNAVGYSTKLPNSNRSNEIASYWISKGIQLDKYGHWGIATALGIGYSRFYQNDNFAFERIDGITTLAEAPEGIDYSRSWVRWWSVRIPVSLEWQTTRRYADQHIFLSAGVEMEIRTYLKSRAKWEGSKHTISDELNYNRLGANLMFQAGYGQWGLSARFALTPLFEKNYSNVRVYPASIGLSLYW